MKTPEFNRLIEEQIQRCKDTLIKKGDEYATEKDRLHNFNVAGELTGKGARSALAGMMVKHTVSVYDMAESDDIFDLEVWNEKITDHINYLLLLRTLVEETDKPAVELATFHDRSLELVPSAEG